MGRRVISMAVVKAGEEVGLINKIWLGRERGGDVIGVVKGDLP